MALQPLASVPRCVMTTLPQEDLPADAEVLRSISRHNRRPFGRKGSYPCVGVYAQVVAGGRVARGDPVRLDR